MRMIEASGNEDSQARHDRVTACFGGTHNAYVVERGRYIEIHGASRPMLNRFEQQHPGTVEVQTMGAK